MTVYAPVASQVYQRNVEPGEYVSPGVPLITLIDLGDLWIHFDLREDLVRTLKVGDRFAVRIPALADRRITVEVKLIATKGEYASWRATRATGDFDLRTFSIRAYPVDKVPELRPGMPWTFDWVATLRSAFAPSIAGPNAMTIGPSGELISPTTEGPVWTLTATSIFAA